MISWTRDLIAPSITITSLEGNSPIISSVFTNLRLIFTISEDVSGFDINDITVEGGKLSLFSGSSGDSRYEVTLSPDKYVNGETPNGTYTEGAGCPSETQLIANADDCEDARSDLTWGGSINVNNRPSGCIADNTAVYFNSQNVIDQTLIGSDRVVCEKLAGDLSVHIQSAAFQDPAGNDNSASNSFEWSFDKVAPILQISHQGILKISYLVVAGGGGAASGGGGGGGFLEELDVSFDCPDSPRIDISVGEGGTYGHGGNGHSGLKSTNGEDSVLVLCSGDQEKEIRAIGGVRGGGFGERCGGNGGSGGGSSYDMVRCAGSGTTAQGNDGSVSLYAGYILFSRCFSRRHSFTH